MSVEVKAAERVQAGAAGRFTRVRRDELAGIPAHSNGDTAYIATSGMGQGVLTLDPPLRRSPARAGNGEGSNSGVVKLRATRLLGIPLAEVSYSDVVWLINGVLAAGPRTTLTVDAINTMGLSESCVDSRMREALNGYDLILPDGMPLVWCMNAKGAGLPDRVYGPYLTDQLLAGLERPTRVAVIGGFSDVHAWLRRAGRAQYPNAQFALLYDAPPGPIDDAYVHDCMERIDASGAELVFVCLGVPRQYYWTALARPLLGGRVCVSVGGAFDFVSGARRCAPPWMQRAGLTWLHRLVQEPRRLGPRYLKYNTAFLRLLFTQEVLGHRRQRALARP